MGKAASDRVKAAESTLDQVKFQSTILQKVNDMRLELEKYNYASATRRMAMYKKVQTFLGDAKENVIDESVSICMPKILGDLLDTFVISTSECLERANASGVTEIVGALGNQSF